MICPNCKKRIKYWSEININQDYNFEKGFYCPHCHALLVAKNFSRVKATAFLIFISLAVIFYGIIFICHKFIDKNSFGNVFLFGLPIIAFVLGLPYILYGRLELVVKNNKQSSDKKFIKKDETDPLMQKIRRNTNNFFNRLNPVLTPEQANKKYLNIFIYQLLLFVVIMSAVLFYYIFKRELSFASFIFLAPLVVWILWIRKTGGKKWTLLTGVIIMIIVAAILLYFFSQWEMEKINKEMEYKNTIYRNCIEREIEQKRSYNIDVQRCLEEAYGDIK
jgi:uncharacterized protein YlaI